MLYTDSKIGILGLFLVSVIFITGCTSTSTQTNNAENTITSQQQSTASQQQSIDDWTKLCNLNDACKNLQNKCSDAFKRGDAKISYDTYKKSPTYGQGNLVIYGYMGNYCQQWFDWVIIASEQLDSQNTPKDYIWQWVENAGYSSFDKDTCVDTICQPYLLGDYSIWKKCSDLCGQSIDSAINYIKNISLTKTLWDPTGKYEPNKQVKYEINDSEVHLYQNGSVIPVATFITSMKGHNFATGEKLELDFYNNKIDGNVATYISFSQKAIAGFGFWNNPVDIGNEIGRYHISIDIINESSIKIITQTPNSSLAEKNITNLNGLLFQISISVGDNSNGFDFEFKNFKING